MDHRFLTREELDARRGAAEIARLSGGDEGLVDAAIAGAEEEAVSYLLSRYIDRLPSTPEATPGVLKDNLAVLAHRRLAKGPQVSDVLQAEARDARTWLSQVSRGVASLNLPDAAAIAVDTSGPLIAAANDPCADPPLSFKTLKGW